MNSEYDECTKVIMDGWSGAGVGGNFPQEGGGAVSPDIELGCQKGTGSHRNG